MARGVSRESIRYSFWGKWRGIDVEAKGSSSLNAMRVNPTRIRNPSSIARLLLVFALRTVRPDGEDDY